MEKNLVCGTKMSVIKKAFFNGKLSQLVNEMQGAGNLSSPEEAKELKTYLESLKEQNKSVVEEMEQGFSEELGAGEVKPPSVEELTKDDPNLEQWEREKDKAIELVKAKMKSVRDKLGKETSFNIKELQDLAFELSFWTMWISQDEIYKRQLWKKKLIQIMEEHNLNRRTAEDYSEVTNEYRDFKLAQDFRSIVDSLIISARRGYSDG